MAWGPSQPNLRAHLILRFFESMPTIFIICHQINLEKTIHFQFALCECCPFENCYDTSQSPAK